MKIGFIGAGNMASAIIKGIIAKKFIPANQIYVYDIDHQKVNDLSFETKIQKATTNEELIELCDMIVIAIKPNMFEKVLSPLAKLVTKEKCIVSIAAGMTLESLENIFAKDTSIIRVMPNVNATVNQGVAAICKNDSANDSQLNAICDIFNAVGKAYILDEKDFSTFIGIAGSSPAFAYLFIDTLARAAVKNGLPKDLATEIAAHAVLGSAKMVLDSDAIPWELIDRVCSPGGTTVAGLLKLEEEGFMNSIIKCVDETIVKDKELQKK